MIAFASKSRFPDGLESFAFAALDESMVRLT
jgi:hypothetical protein